MTNNRPKESSSVSGNRPGEKFLSLTRPHSQICIRIKIFKFQKNKQISKNKNTKKAKETNEEKRLSLENQLSKHILPSMIL